MSLEYLIAKNNSRTCLYSNVHLHSAYNPENESHRFVENIQIDYIPENIIIIEPALAYCNQFLKEKFPNSKLYAIRFLDKINSIGKFEKEFFYTNSQNLKNELYNFFGEEKLLNSLFISWPPAIKAFPEKDKEVWTTLQKLLKESQNILATRQFFSKRWIKNQIIFFTNLTKITNLKKIDLPILICASGPSLNDSLSFIKQYQNNFFIICCSSAIKSLINNSITPDFCISTDGGFWAKTHLKVLLKKNNIPLAISPESNIYSKIFKSNTIIPLQYTDSLTNDLFLKLNIDYNLCKRNGTISGTTVDLANSLTTENIYLCGIDLESSSGFCHTQPNELETNNSIYDNKLNTKEKRIFMQSRDSIQLEIYRNWFINNSYLFANKVFRISKEKKFKHSLNQIKDITWNELLSQNTILKKIKTNNFFTEKKEIKPNKKIIKDFFEKKLSQIEFIKEYYPADLIMINRSKGEQKIKYEQILQNKIDEIKKYLYKITKEN